MEDICTAFCTLCNNLRGVNFSKALREHKLPETVCNAFLNLKDSTFIHVSQRNSTVVQINIQRTAQFRIENFQRNFFIGCRNHSQVLQLQFQTADSLFIFLYNTRYRYKIAFPNAIHFFCTNRRVIDCLHEIPTRSQNNKCKAAHLTNLMHASL